MRLSAVGLLAALVLSACQPPAPNDLVCEYGENGFASCQRFPAPLEVNA